jgi:hypothetical protein
LLFVVSHVRNGGSRHSCFLCCLLLVIYATAGLVVRVFLLFVVSHVRSATIHMYEVIPCCTRACTQILLYTILRTQGDKDTTYDTSSYISLVYYRAI